MTLTLREALLAFRRAPLLSVLSVVTIAFSLYVVGLFGLVAVNLRAALAAIEERVEIVAYLLPGTPVEAAVQVSDDVSAFPEVAAALYVSEEEALGRAQRELPEFRSVLSDFDVNPLPASVEIRLRPGQRDAPTVTRVAERVGAFSVVEDVRFGRDWIERLDRLRQIAAGVGLAVGLAFAAVSVIIIGTTIRMAVLQRGSEIAIMRLVGATNNFIRRPFLLEGLIKGMLGGVLAVGLSFGSYVLIDRFLLEASFFTIAEALILVLFGMLIGYLSSIVTVDRHLRAV
jgi:cell division transport system permease protein